MGIPADPISPVRLLLSTFGFRHILEGFSPRMRKWRNGRRTSLRGWRSQDRGGSNPPFRIPTLTPSLSDDIRLYILASRSEANDAGSDYGAFRRLTGRQGSVDVCASLRS